MTQTVAPASAESPITRLSQVTPHTWRVFFICLAGVTFANLDLNLFALVLTDISLEFGWSVQERGWYLALTFVVSGILITQLGTLADRIGRRQLAQCRGRVRGGPAAPGAIR